MRKPKKVPIRIGNIRIEDEFWSGRIRLIASEVIPYQLDILNDAVPGTEPSHEIENFRIAAGESKNKFYGMIFQDSDVAKWIEAASFSLAGYPNPGLEEKMDELIALIGRAQRPDGYLNTYFSVVEPENRFANMTFGHELYCAGHMIEAAVAYFETTGKKNLLDIVCRYADYIDSVFGPEEHKARKYCGHEEIELALVKLYRVTGEEKYLKLSKYFIDERGKQPCFFKDEPSFGNWEKKHVGRIEWFDLDYHQAHAPVREQQKADGHSVRAMYLYSAMADLALETDDLPLQDSLRVLWDNVANHRMYITGGLGSQEWGERFTTDYDLPNDTVYGETCASIGLIFWAYRMLALDPDRRYADVMEQTLYNGAMSGISLDGKKYFYVNPLEVVPRTIAKRYDLRHVKTERQLWFGCACCPPNIARLIASLGRYIYTIDNDTTYVHLYMKSSAKLEIGGTEVDLIQETDYPRTGGIRISVEPAREKEFTIALRIPAWCSDYTATINGKNAGSKLEKGYLKIRRAWKKGDVVSLDLGMEIRLVRANPKVRENIGKVAILRGPVVYCLEETDNGSGLARIILSSEAKLTAEYDSQVLGGITIIRGRALRLDEAAWGKELYGTVENKMIKTNITAIPYSMWANRSPGEMLVWINKNDA
jgi:uncharacterized protein